jgi:uncharacterized membrane protein YdbT with pleckstrin-like domain
MARGNPALWSALVGVPFVIAGAWLYVGQTQYPPLVGLPFAGFGLFVIAVGAYVHTVAPTELRVGDSEKLVATRHPTQRVATVKVGVGLPLLVATVYLLYFTRVPYVYPTLTLVAGLYLFSVGLYTYWTNSLTTYYLTTDRVVKEYRFLSLVRQEVPREKIRGVQERRSFTETMVGLGNVLVASGGGRSLEVRMRNMEGSDSFADSVREVISR